MNTQRMPRNFIFWSLIIVLILGFFSLEAWLIFGLIKKPAHGAHSTGTQRITDMTPAPIPVKTSSPSSTGSNQIPVPMAAGTNDDRIAAANGSASIPEACTQQAGDNLPIVCIDPGHPSEVNRGTTVQNGLQEVEIVYDVALKLKKELENPADQIARVVMTRDFRSGTGEIVTNRERAEIANNAGAVLLLRLHTDTGKGSGYTIYYPDRVGRAKDGKTGPSEKVIADSGKAAQLFHDGMAEIIQHSLTTLHDNGVKGESATYIGRKQGALTGSIYSKVPSLTIEMVYLSNPTDAEIIGSEDGQQMMAKALKSGIVRMLEAFGYRK